MLRTDGLRVSFGDSTALAGVDLEVERGERLAVLGPSGSGKSTLLRTIAGLVRPDSGRVVVAGVDLSDVPPHRRGVGLVHQAGVLFPHLDVAENVSFGLRARGVARATCRQRSKELLGLVGLSGFERRPITTLSGGEAQRVALARALAPEPRLLLLDEPLAALDRPLRERLLREIAAILRGLDVTVVHVTHDLAEAFSLGDRVAVMCAGRIAQHSTPDTLWRRPADEWTARFLGMSNIRSRSGRTTLVRPEAVRLRPGGDAVVVRTERRGASVHIWVRLSDGDELEAVTTQPGHARSGDYVHVSVDPAGVVELGPIDRQAERRTLGHRRSNEPGAPVTSE